jgi:hypothetical protein
MIGSAARTSASLACLVVAATFSGCSANSGKPMDRAEIANPVDPAAEVEEVHALMAATKQRIAAVGGAEAAGRPIHVDTVIRSAGRHHHGVAASSHSKTSA